MIRIWALAAAVTLGAVSPIRAQVASPAELHADKAAESIQRGDLRTAEAELRKAVELSPDEARLLTSLGGVLGMRGNLKQANSFLAKAVKLKPQDPLLLRNLAANEWQLGRFHEAQVHLESVLRSNAGDQGAIFLLGMVAENEKDYARSIALLESVPEVIDRQPEALVALASSYYHGNRRGDAKSVLRKLAGRAAPSQTVLMGGRVAIDAGDYVVAEELLASIRNKHSDPASVVALLALAQYRGGRAPDSEKTLLQAVADGHANREAYVLLCKVLADRAAYARALELAGKAATLYPDSHEVLIAKAAMEMKLHHFSAAVVTSKKAAAMYPSAETKRELAVALWRSGDRKAATAEFEGAISKYPKDAQTYEEYGTLLLEDASMESKARALAVLKQAIAINGSAVEARYQLANIAIEENKLPEALAHLDKALQADPGDSRLHFTLSRVYRRLGREAEAASEMEKYEKLKKSVE